MKTLFVLRHAKSSWDDPELRDRDRPLAPRGERDALRLAGYVDLARIRPEVVLCSPARRTQATLAGIERVLGSGDVRTEGALYGASAGEIVSLLRRLPASVSSVMVIGHNPGLEDVVELLSGDGADAALNQLRTKFPTGALATLALEVVDWATLAPGVAYLQQLVTPKQLQDT